MSKSNKMFADKAFEMIKELERSSQTIPPFDVRIHFGTPNQFGLNFLGKGLVREI